MKIHELKTIEPFFSQVYLGEKRFELRFNDRNFQKGDYLLLQCWNKDGEFLTGESVLVRVKSVLKDFTGLESNYCVMSISNPLE